MAVVYRHIRLDKNEPFYIGIGKTSRRAYSKSDRNSYWKSISKKGYLVEILFEDLNWDKACEKEKEFIKLYGRRDLGTGILVNKTDGGDGLKNISQQTRELMRLVQLGKKHTEQTKEKMRMSHIGEKNIFYGRKHSLDTKNRIKQKKLGLKTSQITKQKMSDSHKLRHTLNPYYDNSILSEMKTLLNNGLRACQIQKKLNIPRTSFYRLIKKIKEN